MSDSSGTVNSISEPAKTFVCIYETPWAMRELETWEVCQMLLRESECQKLQIDVFVIDPTWKSRMDFQLVWEFRSTDGESQYRFTKNVSFLVSLGDWWLSKACFSRGLSSFRQAFNRFSYMFLCAIEEMMMEW